MIHALKKSPPKNLVQDLNEKIKRNDHLTCFRLGYLSVWEKEARRMALCVDMARWCLCCVTKFKESKSQRLPSLLVEQWLARFCWQVHLTQMQLTWARKRPHDAVASSSLEYRKGGLQKKTSWYFGRNNRKTKPKHGFLYLF